MVQERAKTQNLLGGTHSKRAPICCVKNFNLGYCFQKLSVMTLNHPFQIFVVSSQHENNQAR